MAEGKAADGTTDQVTAGLDRRRVLLGAGAVGLAGLLAACGGDDNSNGAATDEEPAVDTTDESTGESAEDTGGDTEEGGDDTEDRPEDDAEDDAGPADGLVATSDVPVGEGVVLADDDIVVTQPAAGEFRAFSATCTHQGCAVAGVADGTINCTCHGSRFSIDDGSVANGPATQPLPEVAIAVEGDQIVRA